MLKFEFLGKFTLQKTTLQAKKRKSVFFGMFFSKKKHFLAFFYNLTGYKPKLF
jgi:hypothetical protein